MSELFTTFIHDCLRERRMTADELAHEMGFARKAGVAGWLRGWTRPQPGDLPRLARALGVHPVELAVGWLADAVPELEPALTTEVLAPRKSRFPTRDDLSLRARDLRPSASVLDPHDGGPPGSAPTRPRRHTARRAGRDGGRP